MLQISGIYKKHIAKEVLERVYKTFCQTLNFNKADASIVFCSSAKMRSINHKYRGLDKTTDVISFASNDKADVEKHSNEPIYLGELIIDINYLIKQKEQHSLEHSIIERVVHGLLHLAGYDHLNTKQKEEMQIIEKDIMTLIQQEGFSD